MRLRFSAKQREALLWWTGEEDFDGIICDGAV